MENLKRILILRLSSFGDIVLTFPLINKIKAENPNSEIHFLVKKKFSGILKLNPFIDKILNFEDDTISNHRKYIVSWKYSLIIDLHSSNRSLMLTMFLNENVVRYKKESWKKVLYALTKINLLKNSLPVYGKYLNAVFPKGKAVFSVSNLVFESNINVDVPYILLAPSSQHFTKIYPKEKFVEFIKNKSTKTFVLAGDNSKRDMEICEYISGRCPNVINYCGKTAYKDLAFLISNASFVISNDSGILHLAEALNKKVYVIFGSTVKEFGFFPQLKSSVVFENIGLKCRPCTHIGRENCQKKHFNCMNEIKLNIES